MKRTNTCNELTAADKGKEVSLIGWVQSVRDHGGILFIDLRDRDGITQVVFHPEAANVYEKAQKLKDESVIQIFGKVELREDGTKNPNLKTGEIEVVASDMVIHNICDVLPFPLDDEHADRVNEDLRLQYRYLDLRRPRNLNLLRMRHKAAQAIRDYLNSQDFIEVETPILFKSTPEGAREFLVPSRTNPGMFYALNQSPQQYKQMLMVSGIERYYQMAKCFRDEEPPRRPPARIYRRSISSLASSTAKTCTRLSKTCSKKSGRTPSEWTFPRPSPACSTATP